MRCFGLHASVQGSIAASSKPDTEKKQTKLEQCQPGIRMLAYHLVRCHVVCSLLLRHLVRRLREGWLQHLFTQPDPGPC